MSDLKDDMFESMRAGDARKPSSRTQGTIATPQQSLFTLRIIWTAALLGQFLFLGVVLFLIAGAEPAGGSPMENVLFLVSCGVTAAAIPLAFFLRNQFYKSGWQADAVSPNAYFTGMMFWYAVIEMASLFGLVVVLLSDQLWPYVVPSALCMALHVANFPSGKPMQPDEFAALRQMGRDSRS